MQFDWYAATVPEKDANRVIDYMASLQPLGSIESARPRHGYEGQTVIRGEDGDVWASILHGGTNGINVYGSGASANVVADAIREAWPWHMVSRADVASDMRGEGVFEQLVPVCQRVMRGHGVTGRQLRDDDPEKGVTYYMGSRSSQTFGRLYEKGKEQYAKTKDKKYLEYLDWIRLELETKPQKQNRLECSQYSPDQFWGMSRWARTIAQEVLSHEAAKVGVSLYKVSDTMLSRMHLVRQYYKMLDHWADDLGSWADLGLTLKELVGSMKKERGL